MAAVHSVLLSDSEDKEIITITSIKAISSLDEAKFILINLLERIEKLEGHEKLDLIMILNQKFLDQDITISSSPFGYTIKDEANIMKNIEEDDFIPKLSEYGIIEMHFIEFKKIISLIITNHSLYIESEFKIYLKTKYQNDEYCEDFTIYKIEEI